MQWYTDWGIRISFFGAVWAASMGLLYNVPGWQVAAIVFCLLIGALLFFARDLSASIVATIIFWLGTIGIGFLAMTTAHLAYFGICFFLYLTLCVFGLISSLFIQSVTVPAE